MEESIDLSRTQKPGKQKLVVLCKLCCGVGFLWWKNECFTWLSRQVQQKLEKVWKVGLWTGPSLALVLFTAQSYPPSLKDNSAHERLQTNSQPLNKEN